MADRRMYAKQILASDAFLGLPRTAQLLYLYIALYADDEGLLNSPYMVMRMCDASKVDLDILIANGYLILFDSGVVAVVHWLVHNNISKLLRQKSQNTAERTQIRVDPASKFYILINDKPCTDRAAITLDEIDDELDDRNRKDRDTYGTYRNVRLSKTEFAALQEEYPQDYADRINHLSAYLEKTGKRYPNHLATIRHWAAEDAAQAKATANPFVHLTEGG